MSDYPWPSWACNPERRAEFEARCEPSRERYGISKEEVIDYLEVLPYSEIPDEEGLYRVLEFLEERGRKRPPEEER